MQRSPRAAPCTAERHLLVQAPPRLESPAHEEVTHSGEPMVGSRVGGPCTVWQVNLQRRWGFHPPPPPPRVANCALGALDGSGSRVQGTRSAWNLCSSHDNDPGDERSDFDSLQLHFPARRWKLAVTVR